jgi:hypothetical protein
MSKIKHGEAAANRAAVALAIGWMMAAHFVTASC